MKKHCNCTHSGHIPENDNIENSDYCFSMTQPFSILYQRHLCVVSHHTNLYDECFKSCQYRCATTKYTTQATYSKWPAPSQYDSFYEQVIVHSSVANHFQDVFENRSDGDSINVKERNYKRQLIDDNFVHIQFIMDIRGYLEYTEVPICSISSLIGVLGGSLNLWTAITVFVFIELLECHQRYVEERRHRHQEEDRCRFFISDCKGNFVQSKVLRQVLAKFANF